VGKCNVFAKQVGGILGKDLANISIHHLGPVLLFLIKLQVVWLTSSHADSGILHLVQVAANLLDAFKVANMRLCSEA